MDTTFTGLNSVHTADLYGFYSWKEIVLFERAENEGDERRGERSSQCSASADLHRPERPTAESQSFLGACSEEESNYPLKWVTMLVCLKVTKADINPNYRDKCNAVIFHCFFLIWLPSDTSDPQDFLN